jgi:hypothetical protein
MIAEHVRIRIARNQRIRLRLRSASTNHIRAVIALFVG